MALSGVGHHTSEAVVASHDGELLVAYLHVEGCEVNVELVVEEVEMRSKLVVPAAFRLVLYGLGNALIVGVIVLDIHICTCRFRLCGQLAL